MKEIKTKTYKGTRILLGNEKRNLINDMIDLLNSNGFTEISIPIIQHVEIFANKVGDNGKMMYEFTDRGERNLCLAPEYTAVVQQLAETEFKYEKDVKLFYVQECFRGEKPQAGRYRQFTQLGVEILNPSKDYYSSLVGLAQRLVSTVTTDFNVNIEVSRGLEYYTNGKGFEISCDKLGAQKQIVGGGSYDGGIGFAIGIDRLLLINK